MAAEHIAEHIERAWHCRILHASAEIRNQARAPLSHSANRRRRYIQRADGPASRSTRVHRRSAMRTVCWARWATCALAILICVPALADHKKSIADCTSFDQVEKGDDAVE